MCKAVLDINLVTGNILGARNARTNEVAPMASGPASQLRLKAKKPQDKYISCLIQFFLLGSKLELCLSINSL